MNTIPEPTGDEQRTLDMHIGEWATRTPVQRGACLGIVWGHNSLPKLERYLDVPEAELFAELQARRMRPVGGRES